MDGLWSERLIYPSCILLCMPHCMLRIYTITLYCLFILCAVLCRWVGMTMEYRSSLGLDHLM